MINKKKFSLNNMLNNKKIALIISLVIAIAIWATVAFNSTDEVREIRVSAYPLSLGIDSKLIIYENEEVSFNVTVEGRRWSINRLETKDLQISVDYSKVATSSGEHPITINVASSGEYKVTNVYPNTFSVKSDYFIESDFPVKINTENVSLAENMVEKGYALDEVILNLSGLKDGAITVNGPAEVVKKIDAIYATVEEKAVISNNSNFPVKLVAFDSAGNVVNTEHCKFVDVDAANASVNIPLTNIKKVEFKLTYVNVPDALKDRITINPTYVTLQGNADHVDQVADNNELLGDFDLKRINLKNSTKKFELKIPEGVSVVEGISEVIAEFDTSGLSEKTFEKVDLKKENISFVNAPAEHTFETSISALTNVTIVGDSDNVAKVKTSDLRIEIDLLNAGFTSLRNFVPKITVNGYDNVWVFFGTTPDTDYKIMVNGSKN